MKISVKRKLIKLGNSLYVAIPSIFIRFHNIKKGDSLLIEGNLKTLKVKKTKEKAGSKPA